LALWTPDCSCNPDVDGDAMIDDTETPKDFYFLPLSSNGAYDGQCVAIAGIPEASTVPAASTWGVVVMALLVLTTGTLV
jgi:hypothetical protein